MLYFRSFWGWAEFDQQFFDFLTPPAKPPPFGQQSKPVSIKGFISGGFNGICELVKKAMDRVLHYVSTLPPGYALTPRAGTTCGTACTAWCTGWKKYSQMCIFHQFPLVSICKVLDFASFFSLFSHKSATFVPFGYFFLPIWTIFGHFRPFWAAFLQIKPLWLFAWVPGVSQQCWICAKAPITKKNFWVWIRPPEIIPPERGDKAIKYIHLQAMQCTSFLDIKTGVKGTFQLVFSMIKLH